MGLSIFKLILEHRPYDGLARGTMEAQVEGDAPMLRLQPPEPG